MKIFKRQLADELVKGIMEMQKHDAGKLTLHRHKIKNNPLPDLTPEEIRAVRKKLSFSISWFANCLRAQPSIVTKWEQGLSVPNDQAKALLILVDKNPEILKQLSEIE